MSQYALLVVFSLDNSPVLSNASARPNVELNGHTEDLEQQLPQMAERL